MNKNSISLQGNGLLQVNKADGECLNIDTNDPGDILPKLQLLNAVDIAVLHKMANEQNNQLSEVFKTMLVGLVSQKNTVGGNISAETVQIGDKITIQYQAEKTILPKALSAKIPRISKDKIVGREVDLADLHTRFDDKKEVVVVNGLGGIGKTTLVQAYVSTYWEKYQHIVWISKLSENIFEDFINTEGLSDNLKIEAKGKDVKTIFIEIITALKKIDREPNLLIIDNADHTLADLYDYLPKPPLWHILATSREQIHHFDLKTLDFLSEDKAIDLFLNHYTRGKISKNEIRELIKLVDRHTLTIEILAKTAQTQRIDIKRLKSALKEDLRTNVHINHKGDRIEKVTSYLSSIFTISALDNNQRWLLKQMGCLPPEFQSYALLKELIRPEQQEKEEIFSETLEALSTQGWLLQERENDRYKMHRIIADVVKKQDPIVLNEAKEIIESITEKLSIDESKDNPVDKFQWTPYGKSVLEISPECTDSDISRLQNNLALVLQALGDYEGAKGLLEKALASDERNFGPEHPTTAVRYSNLALVLQDLGDYEGAKGLLEKTLASAERNFGPEHPTTAVRYSNLATVLKDLGDYEGAKGFLEKALASAERNFGPEHPTTAVSYSNLATVLQALGDYEGAKGLLEKALASDERNFGPEHPSTARSSSNLALVLKALGDYEGARGLLEKALASDERNFGPERLTTARYYSNLASVLGALGDYEKALEFSGRSIRIIKKVLPEGHPNMKRASRIYQSILEKMDKERRSE